MKMFLGMKILWTFKGSSQKGSFLCILGVVSKGQGTELVIFFWVVNQKKELC